MFPDVKIDTQELRAGLIEEVLKREITEGEKADEARRRIAKARGRALRAKAKAAATNGAEEPERPAEARLGLPGSV